MEMEEESRNMLSKKIKLPKKQGLSQLRKKIIAPGELPYDLSERKRSKRAYAINRNTEGNLSSPATTALEEPVPSTSQSVDFPCCISGASTIISDSVNIHIPDGDSANTSCQLTEGTPMQIPVPVNSQTTVNIECDFFLDEDQLYLNILCQGGTQTVSISDGLGLFMVLPDLDFARAQLRRDRFVLIQRKAVNFQEEGAKWLCTCSCQPMWSREILSSSNRTCASFNDYMTIYPPCPHRRVSAYIYEQHDNLHQCSPADYFIVYSEDPEHNYSIGIADVEEATRIGSIPIIRIWSVTSKTHGLVSLVKKKYFCFCCEKNHCDHVKRFQYLSERNIDDDNYPQVLQELVDIHNSDLETSSNSSTTRITCHSVEKIPFEPCESLTNIFSSGIIQNVQRYEGRLVFVPNDSVCRHCGGLLDMGDAIEKEWLAGSNVTVVTNTYLGNGTVYYRPCLDCDAVTLFDGQDHCFLNLGSYLVGYDILRSYMHSFLHGRRPLYTFYLVFVDDHYDYGNTKIKEYFSYHKLRSAWLSFLRLLDIDFQSGFSCPDCPSDGPDMIICDGTSLSFQRRMWSWKSPETTARNASKNKSGFRDRVYICEERTRKLLKRYATGGKMYRGKQMPVLNMEEKNDLVRDLRAYPELLQFLKSIDDGSEKLPDMFSDFITSLASKSPVCGYIHPTEEVGKLISGLVKGLDIKCNPVMWQSLHNNIPALFTLLENSFLSSAPHDLRPLLNKLWEAALNPFDNAETVDNHTEAVEEDEMSFFPSLPTCRQRGNYVMDGKKSDNSCHKKYKGHPSLLPGVFTVYCAHGICYGLQVMQTMESPNVPFTILRTRFQTAPKVVIYDNACALHAYCLNRDANFFRNTVFLVDRLHWDNHVGCSCGYCLDKYPILKGLNSQLNEQANAGLKRIKDQLSYMTAENFMQHCCFYLWNKNVTCINKKS